MINETSNIISKHLTPQKRMLSYPKLISFVKHQIKHYSEIQTKIEENATYYVLQEPQALKDYQMLQDKVDEWEWFLDEILNDDERINTLTI